MRIVIKGVENGTEKTFTYHLLDKYDRETQTISMARTTGYTCTSVAKLVLDGTFNTPGVNAPEAVGAHPGNLSYIFRYLKERGVIYQLSE
jgi:saccharopine dehydrogenase-like NADP-dependent oxidoreductase